MTYQELLNYLHTLPSDKLDDDVIVQAIEHTADEFFPVLGVDTSKDGDPADGILDYGHVYLYTEDMGHHQNWAICRTTKDELQETPTGKMWWSNELGWTPHLKDADHFADWEQQLYRLPMEGVWVKL